MLAGSLFFTNSFITPERENSVRGSLCRSDLICAWQQTPSKPLSSETAIEAGPTVCEIIGFLDSYHPEQTSTVTNRMVGQCGFPDRHSMGQTVSQEADFLSVSQDPPPASIVLSRLETRMLGERTLAQAMSRESASGGAAVVVAPGRHPGAALQRRVGGSNKGAAEKGSDTDSSLSPVGTAWGTAATPKGSEQALEDAAAAEEEEKEGLQQGSEKAKKERKSQGSWSGPANASCKEKSPKKNESTKTIRKVPRPPANGPQPLANGVQLEERVRKPAVPENALRPKAMLRKKPAEPENAVRPKAMLRKRSVVVLSPIVTPEVTQPDDRRASWPSTTLKASQPPADYMCAMPTESSCDSISPWSTPCNDFRPGDPSRLEPLYV